MSELLKNSNGVASSSRNDFVLQEVHVCDICAGAGRADTLAICSRCSDGAEHIYCMRIRMDKVPSGDWVCEQCQFGIQIEGRKTVDIEAIAKMNSFGQASSGSNGRNRKSRAKLSDDENRVGNDSTPKILGKRQSEGVKGFQDMQGSAGSIGGPASETRTPEANSGSNGRRNKKSRAKLSDNENRVGNGSTAKVLGKRQSGMQGDRGETRTPELTSISSGGRVQHLEEKGPHESQQNFIIPDLNSPLGGDDSTFSVESLVLPVVEEEVKSDRSPNSNNPLVGGAITFCGERLFLPVSDEEVKRSGESSALNLNLEPEEAAATKGGEDELSLSLSLSFPDAGTTRTHSSFM